MIRYRQMWLWYWHFLLQSQAREHGGRLATSLSSSYSSVMLSSLYSCCGATRETSWLSDTHTRTQSHTHTRQHTHARTHIRQATHILTHQAGNIHTHTYILHTRTRQHISCWFFAAWFVQLNSSVVGEGGVNNHLYNFLLLRTLLHWHCQGWDPSDIYHDINLLNRGSRSDHAGFRHT